MTGEKKLVLVIDDDEDIRFTITEICSQAGLNAIAAPDGQKGLKLFIEKKPDIVLVDYHMPKIDGLATVKRIRKTDATIPVLVLTVDERQQIADAFLDAGATDFALKPIKAPDLISRININIKIGELLRASAREQKEIFVDKGINNATLRLIVNCLKATNSTLAIEDICREVSLAYPTVHRYLQYLVETGNAGFDIFYGCASKRGRPRNLYYLTDRGEAMSLDLSGQANH
ncbi:two-component system, CitB family, response regulator DctR [Desulfotomaculum arcticum]|uniref:Stage 0 sporulation protein A homolog n=1 Tax=Desulfotruncus arcticus DSM 17038 TaxID=1121424 RepID=A0A1I2TRZ6_9FIRM|nr:response regulator [Desulfotruncus arcticus]SFG65226.1 two-component system, CitB family, response regulator DctR [Desulfotomaculum arcticum] [Desulfotruncus arcticus DSM 17038]